MLSQISNRSPVTPQTCGKLEDTTTFYRQESKEAVIGYYLGFTDRGGYRQFHFCEHFMRFFQIFHQYHQNHPKHLQFLDFMTGKAERNEITGPLRSLPQVQAVFESVAAADHKALFSSSSQVRPDSTVQASRLQALMDLISAYLEEHENYCRDPATANHITEDQIAWLAKHTCPRSHELSLHQDRVVESLLTIADVPFEVARYRWDDLAETLLERYNRVYLQMNVFYGDVCKRDFCEKYCRPVTFNALPFQPKYRPLWMERRMQSAPALTAEPGAGSISVASAASRPGSNSAREPTISINSPSENQPSAVHARFEPTTTTNVLPDLASRSNTGPVVSNFEIPHREHGSAKIILEMSHSFFKPKSINERALLEHYENFIYANDMTLPPQSFQIEFDIMVVKSHVELRNILRQFLNLEKLRLQFFRMAISLSASCKSFRIFGFDLGIATWTDVISGIAEDESNIVRVEYILRPLKEDEPFLYEME